MKKRKIKTPFKIIFAFFILIVVCFTIYKVETGKVSNNNQIISFEVKTGSTYSSLAHSLKQNKLIKSELFYKIYLKLHSPEPLQAGNYELAQNMSVEELINELEHHTKHQSITITFQEGIHFKKVASLLSNKMKIEENIIFDKIKDTAYLDQLIEKYWFLTEEIKQEGIYYALEGYLFPDTYQFNENSKIEDIFEIMLDNTAKKLEKYQNTLKNSPYTIHEMITMASIVELEASNSNDRAGVAGVFYNRLENNWTLGSDVTTYYAVQVELNERDLYQVELEDYNDYNTRSSKMAGKLPISPICMPGLESIEAAFQPEQHDFYYFVADKNGKTYFNKTAMKHSNTVAQLKNEGLWYEY